MRKIYLIGMVALLFACNDRMDDMRPHNRAEAGSYLGSFKNLVNATSGLYGEFLRQAGGFTDGNNYHGTYHPLGELRGNTCFVIEPFNSQTDRCQDAHFFLNGDQKPYSYAWPMWAKTHRLILSASQNIRAIDELYAETRDVTTREKLLRLRGDNCFIRGLMIWNAVNVFGRPYWDEPEKNLGIVLDINAEARELPRSSVKACFEQAIADFKEAAACLPDERSDRTFANRAASYGFLSRIYLYMGGCPDAPVDEYNRLAADYADSVFGMHKDVVELLKGEELADLYENPKNSKEVLFAFTTGNYPSGTIGNVIHNFYSWDGYSVNTPANSSYPCVISRDYENIMDKKQDLRWQYFTEPSLRNPGRFCTCKYNGGMVVTGKNSVSFVAPTIFLRAGEVVLNRAEAYVKLGEDAKALAALNEVRDRAGLAPLSGISGMDLFDEIFLERRRELAFEAQTYYDYVRNGLKMTREERTTLYPNYIGDQYNEIDPRTSRRTMCLVPAEEIQLNKALVQNQY